MTDSFLFHLQQSSYAKWNINDENKKWYYFSSNLFFFFFCELKRQYFLNHFSLNTKTWHKNFCFVTNANLNWFLSMKSRFCHDSYFTCDAFISNDARVVVVIIYFKFYRSIRWIYLIIFSIWHFLTFCFKWFFDDVAEKYFFAIISSIRKAKVNDLPFDEIIW